MPGDKNEHQSVGDKVKPPPEPVLVKQCVDGRMLQVVAENRRDHVHEDQHAGEKNDARVKGRVDGPPGDGRDRQGHQVFFFLPGKKICESAEAQRRSDKRPGRLLGASLGSIAYRCEDVYDEKHRTQPSRCAMPVMKKAPPQTLNWVKSAGSGQYSVYNGA